MCQNFIPIACFLLELKRFIVKSYFEPCDPCVTFWPLKVMWHKWEVLIVIVSKFGGNSSKHVGIMVDWNVDRNLLGFFKEKEITLVLRAELNIAAECEIVEILWTRRDMLCNRVYLIMGSCRLGCSKVPPC